MPEVQWNLAKKVSKLLREYGDEIHDAIDEALPIVGKDTVKYLKENSPHRKGGYAKGWRSKMFIDRTDYKQLKIYNATKGYLTHLLEFGHAKRGGGRVDADPHIFDGAYEGGAYGYSKDRLEEEVVKRIKNI